MDGCHEELGLPFELFPRGCCGDVAELLAAFLKDEGFGTFTYVSGLLESDHISHAWLEKDGVIIDATSDQFEDGIGRPMVTCDKSWHAQFSRCLQHRDDGDFRIVRGDEHLHSAYDRIRELDLVNGKE